VSFQQTQKFPSERPFAVMDLLIADVFSEVFVIKSCDRERAIPMLPFEILAVRDCLVNPTGRIRLDGAN
jgi:hypothetical protein